MHYIMTPEDFAKEFGSRRNCRSHALREAETDPVNRIVVVENVPFSAYRDGVLENCLGYEIKWRPQRLPDAVYTRLFVAGFGTEDFQGFKSLTEKPARRHLRVSRILKGEDISATTAHEDYTGLDLPKLILSHLPQFIPSPPRIAGDYTAGEEGVIRELNELGV